jgi:hypothetical protein
VAPRQCQIRIPQNCWGVIQEHLRQATSWHEPVLFAFTSYAVTGRQDVVLVHDVVVPPESVFVKTNTHGAQWTAKYNVELLNRCLDTQHGLLVLHRHGGNHVRMSPDDLDSAYRLLPRFQSDIAFRAHGSVVLGHCSMAGLLWLPNRVEPIDNFELRAIDTHMSTFPLPANRLLDVWVNARQPLTDTAFSRKLLKRIRVAVVGLSGGGTQLATQLAAAGIGELIGIDYQRLDAGNRLSTDTVSWVDLALRRTKLSAIRRRIWWINPSCRFTGIASRLPEQPAIDALKNADIIVGCVNNLAARADILEIAGRYCIPYVDIGLTIRTADDVPDPAPIVAIAGHVFNYLPGGPCLWCSGYLTKERLEADSGGLDRSYLWSSTERIRREALVSPFNGVLANQSACDVLQLILGYFESPSGGTYKMYDGLLGTLTSWEVSKRNGCPHCTGTVARGDPVWS